MTDEYPSGRGPEEYDVLTTWEARMNIGNSEIGGDYNDWEEEEFVDYYDPDTDCHECRGSGQVPTESWECIETGHHYKTCPACGGNG